MLMVAEDILGLAARAGNFKMNTSGPNPWCWAHNDRIGPDVVTFGVNLSQKNQNKHDNIGPHKTTPKMTTSGPNPGSGARKPRFWARCGCLSWLFWMG